MLNQQAIDIDSVTNRKFPNSFFQKIFVKENKSDYNIEVLLSTYDFLINNKNGWFGSNGSEFYNIHVDMVTDNSYFDSINSQNFLNIEKNPTIVKKEIKNIMHLLGDQKNMHNNKLEISTDEEKIYKFFYKFMFSVPKDTKFLGFVTYVSCNSVEYIKSNNLSSFINFNDLNDNFTLEKIEIMKDGIKNNMIMKPFTDKNLLWCDSYITEINERSKERSPTDPSSYTYYYYYSNGEKKILTMKKVEMPIVYFNDIKPIQININNLKTNAKKDLVKQPIIGDVYTSIDEAKSLNIKFCIDPVKFILKTSSLMNVINFDFLYFDNIVKSQFLDKTSIGRVILSRINTRSGLDVMMRDVSHEQKNTNIWIGDQTEFQQKLSKPRMFSFEDITLSGLEIEKYNYEFSAEIQDGLMRYIKEIIDYAKTQKKLFQEYMADALAKSRVLDENYNTIYYDKEISQFTNTFIDHQSKPESFWSKCKDVAEVYRILYNLFNQTIIYNTGIDNNINPKTCSLESLQYFYDCFENLIYFSSQYILGVKDSYILKHRILSEVKPNKNKVFSDFSKNINSDNIKNFKQMNFLYYLDRQSNVLDRKFVDLDHIDKTIKTVRDYKVQLDFFSLLLHHLKKTNSTISYDHILLYNILSKNMPHLIELLNNKENIFNLFNEYINKKNLDELISLYQYYSGDKLNVEEVTKTDFLTNGKYSISNHIKGKFSQEYMDGIKILNSEFIKNYRKVIFFIMRYCKTAKIQYLSGHIDGDLKKPIWLNVDGKSEQSINSILSSNMKILLRIVPIDFHNLGFFDDASLKLDIINEYITFK